MIKLNSGAFALATVLLTTGADQLKADVLTDARTCERVHAAIKKKGMPLVEGRIGYTRMHSTPTLTVQGTAFQINSKVVDAFKSAGTGLLGGEQVEIFSTGKAEGTVFLKTNSSVCVLFLQGEKLEPFR